MQLYIDTASTSLTVKNASFLVENESTKRLISPRRVSSIAILTNVTFNSAVIKLAAECEIPILYFDRTGNLLAQLRGPSFLKQSRLRYQQILFMNSPEGKNWVIEQLVLKTELQLETLARYGRELPKGKTNLQELSRSMKMKKETLINLDYDQPDSATSIMGIEGGIARFYFRGLNLILPAEYTFTKRSRQPALDYFNASLNYLYGMTYGEITKAVHAAGLDSFVGGLHRTANKENLVFDCIEPFRPIIDRLLVEMCRDAVLNETHFKPVKNGFWLSRSGKRVTIEKYNEYVHRRISFVGKTRSIRHHFYAHARSLKEQINKYSANVSDLL